MAKRPLRLVVNRKSPQREISGLYLITDDGDNLVERVAKGIDGGAKIVQFRSKILGPDERRAAAVEIRTLCSNAGIPFIVNDDVHLAKEVDADGVHLGQDDGTVAEARKILGAEAIVGVSTHSVEEARKAEADGADYIGFGAMFPTRSKDVLHLPGPGMLAEIRRSVNIPIVAIGGIDGRNAGTVIDAGADAIAVISAVLSDSAPGTAAAELSLLFRRRGEFPRGSVLTVAGSDSGGGAGIQADVKTITLLGSYASTAITALTAQNTRGVSGVHPVPVSFVEDQLRAVLSDLPVDVVKTGMLYSGEIIRSVAAVLKEFGKKIVVVDPVMIAKGGAPLMDRDGVEAIREWLMPMTYLLTPNIPEAEKLTGLTIDTVERMEEAARALHAMGARNVLLKGGHLPEGDAVDILFDGSGFHRYGAPRVLTRNSHGTGCTTASAVATYLAQGEPLPRAVARAKDFVTSALRHSQQMGRGHGPVNHFAAARETGPAGTER